MEMSRLTRDGVTEPVSRDQILRREGGQGNIHFPCSADHERDWQPYPVDPSFSAGASIYLSSTANRLRGSVPSLSGHASAYRWRSLAGVRRHTVPLVLKVVPVTGASFQVSPCCCCCCFLTLTDPLRIQPWSQDRRNQTKSTGNRR